MVSLDPLHQKGVAEEESRVLIQRLLDALRAAGCPGMVARRRFARHTPKRLFRRGTRIYEDLPPAWEVGTIHWPTWHYDMSGSGSDISVGITADYAIVPMDEVPPTGSEPGFGYKKALERPLVQPELETIADALKRMVAFHGVDVAMDQSIDGPTWRGDDPVSRSRPRRERR